MGQRHDTQWYFCAAKNGDCSRKYVSRTSDLDNSVSRANSFAVQHAETWKSAARSIDRDQAFMFQHLHVHCPLLFMYACSDLHTMSTMEYGWVDLISKIKYPQKFLPTYQGWPTYQVIHCTCIASTNSGMGCHISTCFTILFIVSAFSFLSFRCTVVSSRKWR